MKENIMRTIRIERVVLNVGGVAEKLNKGEILLAKLSGEKPVKVKALKRIPTWGVRPGLEVGVKVTLRGKKAEEKLNLLLAGIGNILKDRQFQKNFVSFGIKEYIEIPGMEYIREVGIIGLEVSVVFTRSGKRVGLKKVKRGKVRRQSVSAEEIMELMENKFKTKILRRKK
jgi:large subunit ribosomal protein L5